MSTWALYMIGALYLEQAFEAANASKFWLALMVLCYSFASFALVKVAQ